jgi:hypothetical protein
VFIIEARLQAQKSCSYPEFISYIEYLTKQIFTGSIKFMRDIYANPKEIPAPCITYKLISKVPGLIGKDTREIKPRLRHSYTDDEGHVVNVLGQRFDILVQFDIWGHNDEEADQYELRFEQMMLQYMGFLIQNGVVGAYFDSQLADRDAQALRVDLSCRSLRYLVQLEQLTEVKIHDIEQIIINYKVKSDLANLDAEHPANDLTQTLTN